MAPVGVDYRNIQIRSVNLLYIQGVPINIGIQGRIQNRLCKELELCHLISMVKIMLRLLEYI